MSFMGIANIKRGDLVYLGELLEAGKIVPVIDRRFPLRETGKALQYLRDCLNIRQNCESRVNDTDDQITDRLTDRSEWYRNGTIPRSSG